MREIIKIREEINEIETNKATDKVNKSKSWLFANTNKIRKPLVRHRKKEASNKFRNKRELKADQCSSVAQSCPTLCNPMNRSTPGLPAHHQLPELKLKFSKPGFNNTWTVNFQMFKLVLEKAEEPEIKLPTSAASLKKQESSRKTAISALLTMPKPLPVWITIYYGKFERDGNTRPPDLPLRNLPFRNL